MHGKELVLQDSSLIHDILRNNCSEYEGIAVREAQYEMVTYVFNLKYTGAVQDTQQRLRRWGKMRANI